MVVPDEWQLESELGGTRAVAFAVGRQRADYLAIFRRSARRRNVRRRGNSHVRDAQRRDNTGRCRCRWSEAKACGALALQIAGNEVRPERVRWSRRVPLALQVSANRNEAYVGSCARVVALDLNATLDVAKVSLAAPAIVYALKIPADLDAGADKAAQLRALPNLHASTHRHPTFEKRGRALICQDIAVDRRRLLRRIDGETGILQNLHVPYDGCV